MSNLLQNFNTPLILDRTNDSEIISHLVSSYACIKEFESEMASDWGKMGAAIFNSYDAIIYKSDADLNLSLKTFVT